MARPGRDLRQKNVEQLSEEAAAALQGRRGRLADGPQEAGPAGAQPRVRGRLEQTVQVVAVDAGAACGKVIGYAPEPGANLNLSFT